MTAPNISDIAQDDNLVIETTVTGGVRELDMACNHRVVSQLMMQTLLTQLDTVPFSPNFGFDWLSYMSNDAQFQFLQTDLTNTMTGVYGVSSVDLSGATYETEPRLEIGTLCWTIDCANSKSCETLSI